MHGMGYAFYALNLLRVCVIKHVLTRKENQPADRPINNDHY